jgi:5-methylcytosine-specific restriction endonuclease McrA
VQAGPGVIHEADPHHPRGYREIRNREAMRRLLNEKIIEQDAMCGICKKEMTDYRNVVPDHIEPRSMGGANRDDHESNVQAAHRRCNEEKGSQRLRPRVVA